MSDQIIAGSSKEHPLRVSAGSPPQSLASAIAHAIYERGDTVHLRAIGAGAVNQACKAMAIARGYVAPRGYDLVFKAAFDTIPNKDGGEDISAMAFQVVVS